MIPTKKMMRLLGGIIARYQEIFGIEIYAYKFLSNHLHLLVRAPRSNIDEFEENVNREIARRVNMKHRRRGRFWGRPYTDQKVLSMNDLVKAFVYITTNEVHHGLVSHPQKWTGLSSYEQCLTETAVTYTFEHHSAKANEPRETQHQLKLSVLPQFADLSHEDRKKTVLKSIKSHLKRIWRKRKSSGKGFAGLASILRQVPGSRPRQSSQRKRPPCYTADAVLRREFMESRRLRRAQYAIASMRLRAGDLTVKFPEYCFKPPLHRKPRLKKFCPLPESHFRSVESSQR